MFSLQCPHILVGISLVSSRDRRTSSCRMILAHVTRGSPAYGHVMEKKTFDLIVIGAGINGAAIAREAALHNLRVFVLDQGDLCSGTTGWSSRLIHGGLRYLEHAELSLVYESLAERERLLQAAPHLVQPLGLYIPIYRGGRRPLWQIRAGMILYDLLSWKKSFPRHDMYSVAELAERLPGLNSDGLQGGAFYFDGQVTFPERLVVENLRDAIDQGTELATYTLATRLIVERGRVRGFVGAIEWDRKAKHTQP